MDATPRRNYHKGNYGKALSMFSDVCWERELGGKDVDQMWETFCKFFSIVVKQCVLLYDIGKLRKSKKWMNKHLLEMIRKKEEAWKKYRKNMKLKRLLKRYQYTRNKVTSAVRKAKFEYEHKLAKEVKNNPKAFYAMHVVKQL